MSTRSRLLLRSALLLSLLVGLPWRPPSSGSMAAPRVVRWSHGDPPARLLPAARGFCFVSGLGGNFEGGGEAVRLWIDDGDWWVGGRSCQPSLWVEVTCVEWPCVSAPPPLPPCPR